MHHVQSRSHTASEDGGQLSLDLNSISEASNSACAWNIAPVFHVGQKCFSEGAISDCLSGDPHRPWHERKLVLETDARESSFHCSSMCSSASTVVSSTSSTEIPLSFSSTVHDPYHFANPQPANRPDAVHGWFVTPAATLPTLPFSVRPLPPRSAAAHAAEGRDFVRLFEAASSGVGGGGGGGCGSGSSSYPPRRLPPPHPRIPTFRNDYEHGGSAEARAAEHRIYPIFLAILDSSFGLNTHKRTRTRTRTHAHTHARTHTHTHQLNRVGTRSR